ncbi:MAG: metal ABC transporter ATP-binding protein [Acidimicrobiales bacterium]
MTTTPLVRLDHAAVGYDGEVVLSGVDLAIDAGETVAVLGANGSGKSTLVRGLLGLAEVSSGDVELFGTPAAGFRERWRIGYVPQRTNIAGALPATVREVVVSGRLPRLGLGRRLRASDRAAVDAALETVEMSDLADRPVSALSGGQQRRVTIARALASEPDLLILDEPTAGVDAENQARLADTLRRLSAAGTTIVLIAHELGPVADLIGRVVVMRDGGIAFDGAPGDRHVTEHAEHDHGPGDEVGCEHQHEHGDYVTPPPRPGTGLVGW